MKQKPGAERERLERELRDYYGCPPELIEQAADAVEDDGADPAEIVEALVEAGRA